MDTTAGNVLPESENKTSVLEKYQGYYLTEETFHALKAWKHTQLENPQLVHERELV